MLASRPVPHVQSHQRCTAPALSALTPPQTRAADRLRSFATSGSMDSMT